MSEEEPEEEEKGRDSSTVLYEQLQSEYNQLLKRYAQAENTIDELRTGARIHLYADPQDAKTSSRGVVPEVGRHSQRIDFPRPLQASVSCTSTMDGGDYIGAKAAGIPERRERDAFATKPNTKEALSRKVVQDDSLAARIQSLKEDVDSLDNCFSKSDNSLKTLNEILEIYKQLKVEHVELCREVKFLRQSSQLSSRSEGLKHTSKNHMERELFWIGEKLEKIKQGVMDKIKLSKTGQFSRNHKAEKQVSGTLIEPTNQQALSVDPDLSDLMKKLRDLQDASRLGTCGSDKIPTRANNLKANQHNSPITDEQAKVRSLSTWEDQDVVDARYFTASPVHLNYEQNDRGLEDEAYINDAGHMSRENDPKGAELPARVNDARTSGLNNHHRPSLSKKSISGCESGRDHTGSVRTAERVPDAYEGGPFSSESRTSEERSRSPSPPSEPENEDCCNADSRVMDDGKYYENLDQSRDEEYVSPPLHYRAGKTNSLSSLVDSSRMSTPLFHPCGVTRVSSRDAARVSPQAPHGTTYKRRNPSDGCDSGFVGSEGSRSSRMTAESPDIMRKLNLSNHWDSSLRLDFVSEIEENDSEWSPEQTSRTYDANAEAARPYRDPAVPGRTSVDTAESTVVISSPSPPLSPDRARRSPRPYGYNVSRGSNKRSSRNFSSPVPRLHVADPSLSRISERPSSELSSLVVRTTGKGRDTEGQPRDYSRPDTREAVSDISYDRRLPPRNATETPRNDDRSERDSLLALRDDIDTLRKEIKSKLDQPRVTLGMYDELCRHDEESREALEKRNDRKLDDLRRSIDRLEKDFHSRPASEILRQQTPRDRTAYDDLRTQVKNLSEKLNELSDFQKLSPSHGISSGSTSGSFDQRTAAFADEIDKQVRDLASKIDDLKLRLENTGTQGSAELQPSHRYHCHLCDKTVSGHHGYQDVRTRLKPRTSTPLVSEAYDTVLQQPATKAESRSMYHHLSSTYPGAHVQSPVVHHIHTYHRAPRLKEKAYETESSSEESYSSRRRSVHGTSRRKRSRRRPRYQDRHESDPPRLYLPLAEASHAARDVQRLSKHILSTITMDLASLRN